MTAAAQCPTCSHHFDLRDGRGELFPLAYCSSCQSYYRATLGECRWCHTKPERAPIGPHVWKGVGVAALVALVITARLLQDDGSLEPAIQHAKTANAKSTPMPADTVLARTVAMHDTATSRPAIANADSTVRDSIRSDSIRADNIRSDSIRQESTTRVATTSVIAPPPAPPAIARTVPAASPKPAAQLATKPAPTAASKSRRPARWVSSISQDWVVVRADANKRSRLVASLGPNSRVLLGETRGNWRRIRAKGVAGWVEQRAEFRVATNR
jgi:hypothetical protein